MRAQIPKPNARGPSLCPRAASPNPRVCARGRSLRMHTQSLNYSASLKPAPQRGFGGISQSVRQPGIIRVFPDAAHRRGDIVTTLFWCWASVADAGPTLKQHWYNILRVQTHNPWGMTATSPSHPPPPSRIKSLPPRHLVFTATFLSLYPDKMGFYSGDNPRPAWAVFCLNILLYPGEMILFVFSPLKQFIPCLLHPWFQM